jgi:tetratricopeptide (TPR) repeat protein
MLRTGAITLASLLVAMGCAPGPRRMSVQAPAPRPSAPPPRAAALSPAPSTNAPALATNLLVQTPATPAAAPASKEAVEQEYHKLMDADDAAQAEVDKWIRENQDFAAKGAGLPQAELKERIRKRFEPVGKAYEDFIQRHPAHAAARVAYASFLGDLGEERTAQDQLERALTLDPTNPAIYNNLANIYGHEGPVKKAFQYYAKAIELNPLQSVYYHNFGTTVYVFRKDAMEFYALNEQQVFDKALSLYSQALKLDPDNFPLASDVAQTYYAIQPLRADDALNAWTNTLQIAHDEIQREGVYIHLARIKMVAGRFAEARAHLTAVTNALYTELKNRLSRNLDAREHPASQTNAPPPAASEKQP